MQVLRGMALAVRAVLLLIALVGSGAYMVGAGWRDLVGLVPACQGQDGLVTCISGIQPSGLSWYGAAVGAVVWLALLRWSTTSAALRAAARTVITLGMGMLAADLIQGDQVRAVSCYAYTQSGDCLGNFPSLPLTHAALGLLIGAGIAFALIPPRISLPRRGHRPDPAGAPARALDRA